MFNNDSHIRMFKSLIMLVVFSMLPAVGVCAPSPNDSVLQELYEAQRYNDSISAMHKDLQISEYKAKMEALEEEEEAEREELILVIIIAVMAVTFAVFYANKRQKQLHKLRHAYARLEETTAAKERIDSELRIASDIQMAMVPHKFPRYAGLDLYATMLPAKDVGGDLYDCLIIDDMLYFCVGDVSGKGVPAALFMAMGTRLFRTLAKYEKPPGAIADAMNRELCTNNEGHMFITMFIGQLDLWNGRLEYCNCGHNPPALDAELIEMESNVPLGLWDDYHFEQDHLDDIRGQRLFVYSDGLTEAEDHAQSQFGEEQMLEWLRKHPRSNSKEVVDVMLDKVGVHAGNAEQSDDLTILCLKYEN